jgi:uroporphyrinogen-III synthase
VSGRTVLVTRPRPAAAHTARALEALGHRAIVAPLFAIHPISWELPQESFDAVVLTSASAVAASPDALAAATHLPCFTVGAQTAAAAHAAGFGAVTPLGGRAEAMFAELAAMPGGPRRLLYLAGRERTEAPVPEALSVTVVETYHAPALPLEPPAAAAIAQGGVTALLYSERAAIQLAGEVDRLGLDRAVLTIAALSTKVARNAGDGWAEVTTAAEPAEASLFAAAGLAPSR